MSAGLFVSLMLRHYLHPPLKSDIALSLPDLLIFLLDYSSAFDYSWLFWSFTYFSSAMHVFVLMYRARSGLTVILTENTRIRQIHMDTQTHR